MDTYKFQSIDEAVEGSDKKTLRERVESTNPSGIGPETAKVLQEVYAKRAEVGGNIVRYDRDNEKSVSRAIHEASSIVRSAEDLPDASSLGDIFVDVAVKQVLWEAYDIAAARMLGSAEYLDDVPSVACNIEHVAQCMRGEQKMGDNFWQWTYVMGEDLAKKITEAVFKDMGLTKEEAEAHSAKYRALSDKRTEGLKALGWTPGQPVYQILKQNKLPDREFDRYLPQ